MNDTTPGRTMPFSGGTSRRPGVALSHWGPLTGDCGHRAAKGSTRYFAFASDLAAAGGLPKLLSASDLLQCGRGLLPDHRMSSGRVHGGSEPGPPGITSCIGHAVPGMLFEWPSQEPNASASNMLHPLIGSGKEVSVIAGDGNEVLAILCGLANECLGVAMDDLPFFPHPASEPESAAGVHGSQVPLLFVYGTLRRGEARHDQILEHGGVWVASGCAPGRLHDHGAFPGMLPEQGATTFGEVYRFDDISTALKWLDIIEGFRGYGRSGSLFRRTLMDVEDPMGETMLCWAYAILEPKGDLIASGDWIKHRRGVNS